MHLSKISLLLLMPLGLALAQGNATLCTEPKCAEDERNAQLPNDLAKSVKISGSVTCEFWAKNKGCYDVGEREKCVRVIDEGCYEFYGVDECYVVQMCDRTAKDGGLEELWRVGLLSAECEATCKFGPGVAHDIGKSLCCGCDRSTAVAISAGIWARILPAS
ncbi:hypothetical protein V495_01267 [Pseudogymnoascus sp. VKM F-4514 (FW-929)]|nr:hypothetical protein V495_01267 [Pseudogymnoascus sp. VKM F-4514 (FW-929)]KFY54297.1 hypothetical protein V497_07842 [Pseudogymnoascus sp. VKM F-4516 (FW-969)]